MPSMTKRLNHPTPGTEAMDTRPQLVETFETDNAGTLTMGTEFEYRLNDAEGSNYGHFVFHGYIMGAKGNWINAFGGDPIKADHKHRRQWHSLDPARVQATAKPCRKTWQSKRGASD